jgi:hypothetical protein
VAVDDKEDEVLTLPAEIELSELTRYEFLEACTRFAQAEGDWAELL